MPGRRNAKGSFISRAKLLRVANAADVLPKDVVEYIDAFAVGEARNNTIHFQVIKPAGVTQYDIEVHGDFYQNPSKPGPGVGLGNPVLFVPDLPNLPTTFPAEDGRWAIIDGLTARTMSSFITLDRFPPVGQLKVLVTNVTGPVSPAAPFHILYGISE